MPRTAAAPAPAVIEPAAASALAASREPITSGYPAAAHRIARPFPSAPVPPRMPMTGSTGLMGLADLHLRERQHAHTRGFQALAHTARRQHRGRLVAVDAEAVDLALQV